ncbi:MAG: electron transfer flavoprotein subunit beta/FixA family protein [Nitrospira sp.]|nr:electron transfer flavoprotein subunit beta/FixA family protein [Nitrospira sp.]
MNIVVCIKQVPDTSEIKINPETNTLMREGVKSIINPYDLHALEAAVAIREEIGARVTVLTMGPPQAEEALRDALSRGADAAVLLSDRAFAGADTWATSYTLAKAIEKLGADIIFCGKQAIDGDTAQVGPETAEFLKIPHISYVKKIEEIKNNKIKVHRMMDDGYDVVESSLPVLLTVVKDLNDPRYPSLKRMVTAKIADIVRMDKDAIGADEDSLGLRGSPTQVRNIFAPPVMTEKVMLEGSPEEQVESLIGKLREIKCL